MNVNDAITRIQQTTLSGLKWCLVDASKVPYRWDGEKARPNCVADFVDFDKICKADVSKYCGLGISIQASNICAIDVDHCFSKANDIESADDRAIDILSRFSDSAYCEFSFSGTGLRILFDHPEIEDYASKYYIKNTRKNVEFYQPGKSARYVTITGNVIRDDWVKSSVHEPLMKFLDDYMLRPEIVRTIEVSTETRSFEELMKLTKVKYFKDIRFQDLWFKQAPGSGKNESELDFHLLNCIYESITQDKEMVRRIFEESPYFKSKDSKHRWKWENQDHRYFNYVFERISGK